jgi:hypothetical protein
LKTSESLPPLTEDSSSSRPNSGHEEQILDWNSDEFHTRQISSDSDITRILAKFPQTAVAAKDIKETNWQERLFVPHRDGDKICVPVPKNISDFADNYLVISILKIIQIRGWEAVKSSMECKVSVLKHEKNMFFAGYVAKCTEQFCGKRIKASNAYERGVLSAQTDAITAFVGNRNAHIRKTEHTYGKILSEMGGFVREYWALRGAIAALFKDLPKPKVVREDLPSYLLTGGELIGKIVRKSLPHSNGGVFRKEELAYFNSKYANSQEHLDQIHKLCKNPSADFANAFWEYIDELSQMAKKIEKELGVIYALRAKILFRQGSKKKADIKWVRLSLDEKILTFTADELKKIFDPCGLPGFAQITGQTRGESELEDWLISKYKLITDDPLYSQKLAVVSSYTLLRDEALASED